MASRFDNIQSRSIYVGASPNPDPALGNLIIDGSLGIGTSTPSNRFTLITSSSTYSDSFRITDNTGFINVGHWDGINNRFEFSGKPTFFVQYGSSNPLLFGTEGNEKMRITPTGNVGIGTTNPGSQLQVGSYFQIESNANYMGMLGFNRNVNNGQILNTSYSAFQLQNYQGSLQIQIYNSSGVGVTQHTFLNNGNISFNGQLGINTTPIASLDNQGTLGTYRQKGLTTMVTDILYADGTNATRYEIARATIDYNDWNETGVIEIELYEKYWSDGLKKRYLVSYGYSSQQQKFLVEMSGSGVNNFQVSIGTPVTITGDIRYLPIYVDLRYYSRCIASVKSNRNLTTNTTPWVGEISVNAAPAMTYIPDFSPDSAVYAGNVMGGNTLFPSGNVGIGTSTPGGKLGVEGTIMTTGTLNSATGSYSIDHPGVNTWKIGITNANNSTFHIGNDVGGSFANKILNITESGNIGISVGNPLHKLTVGGNISISGGTGYLDFANGDIRFVNSGGLLSVQTYSVGTGLSTKMVVTGAGNVGIGTTAPDFNLTINGITGIQSSGTTKYHFAYYTGGFNFAQTGIADYRLFIQDGGNVGIGTGSPNRKLTVAGEISSNYGSNQGALWLGEIALQNASFTSYGVLDYTLHNGGGYSDIMRIQGNGRVGIGTTNPGYQLEVNGWVGASRYYPYSSNSTYIAGDGAGLTIDGSGYLYAASSGGSYFQGPMRLRNALSNDTNSYLQINGGTANLTYFAGTIGVGTSYVYHSASITSAGKIFLAQTNNSDIGGTIYGYWDSGYQAYAGGLVFQSFNANGGFPYTMKDVMWLTGNGNLGVGTNDTFGNKVSINRGVAGIPAWNNATLELRAESSLTAALVFHRTGQSEASIYSDNGSIVFGEFGGEKMRITGGNVGIGTSSPGAKLEVSGLIKTNRIQLTDGASNGYVLTSDASGNGTWQASVQPFTGNAIPTKPLSGGGYMTYLYNTTTSTTSTANILYLTPFIPINTIRSSSIFIQVITPSAGSTAKIVVYSDSNGSPSSLLIESPLLDCSTSGFKVYALNYNFIAGTTYWVSVVFSSSTVNVTGNSSLQIIAVRTNSNAAWNSFSYTLPSYPTIPATLSLGTGNFSNPASVPRITIVAA